MPIYEFRCRDCRLVVERYLAKPCAYVNCPNCGYSAVRIPSAASFAIEGYAAKNGYSQSLRKIK